eukprot:gene8203-807_t
MSGVVYRRKAQAMSWLHDSGLLGDIEDAINAACANEPHDTHGYMCAYFEETAADPLITQLVVRPGVGLDGSATYVVELHCHMHCRSRHLVSVPLPSLPDDAESDTRIEDVSLVEKEIQGMSLRHLMHVNAILTELKSDVTFSLSYSLIAALATAEKTSFFLQAIKLRGDSDIQTRMPTALIQLFSPIQSRIVWAGKLRIRGVYVRAPRLQSMEDSAKLICRFQKNLRNVISHTKAGSLAVNFTDQGTFPVTLDKLEQTVDIIRTASSAADITLGSDLYIVLDIGASDLYDPAKGKYELGQGMMRASSDLMSEILNLVSNKENGIAAIIDPLSHDDELLPEIISKLNDSKIEVIMSTSSQDNVPVQRVSNASCFRVCLTETTTLLQSMHTFENCRSAGISCFLALTSCCLWKDNPDAVDFAAALNANYFACCLPSAQPRTFERLITLEAELKEMGVLAAPSRTAHVPSASSRRKQITSASQNSSTNDADHVNFSRPESRTSNSANS